MISDEEIYTIAAGEGSGIEKAHRLLRLHRERLAARIRAAAPAYGPHDEYEFEQAARIVEESE